MYAPDFSTFCELAEKADLVPVYRQLVSDTLTPVSAYCKLQWGECSFLFESVIGGEKIGRYSFIGSDPFLQIEAYGNDVVITDHDQNEQTKQVVKQFGTTKGSFRFPLVSDPLTAVNLLLGKDADLFLYDLPGLALNFQYIQSFPIFPGLNARLGGAVSADTGNPEDDGNGTTKFRWRSDNSQTAASFILAYSPVAQPVLRNGAASQQLGYFRSSGNVETASSPFANSVNALAEMVVLNYLGLHGEEANFGMVLDNPGLGTGAAVAPYIAFNPIV